MSSTRLRSKTVGLARNLYNVVGIVSGILNTYMMNPTAFNWKGYAGFFWVRLTHSLCEEEPASLTSSLSLAWAALSGPTFVFPSARAGEHLMRAIVTIVPPGSSIFTEHSGSSIFYSRTASQLESSGPPSSRSKAIIRRSTTRLWRRIEPRKCGDVRDGAGRRVQVLRGGPMERENRAERLFEVTEKSIRIWFYSELPELSGMCTRVDMQVSVED